MGVMGCWFIVANIILGAREPFTATTGWGAFWESAIVASCVLQAVLLGMILALFPGSQLFRLCLTTTLGGMLLLSLALGMTMLGGFDQSIYGLMLGLGPITVLSMSVPYLIAKFWFGWRIVFDGEDLESELPQLTISSLIVATTLIAVAITLLKFVGPELQELLAAIIGCVGVVSVFFLPATMWIYRRRGLLLCFPYAVLLGVVVALLIVPNLTFLAHPSAAAGLGGLAMWMILLYGLFLKAMKSSGLILIDGNLDQSLEEMV